MAHVLVVEDDPTIARELGTALTADGHAVSVANDGRTAMARIGTGPGTDLVLLDLGLPDVDGVELCQRIRSSQPGSVIVVLTARTDPMDVVVGLEAGADDYLTKPFTLAVILARVRAHLRRSSVSDDTTGYTFGDLVIDLRARRCLLRGHPVVLRAKEFELLLRLAREAGAAVSRESLMADVWDENWFGSTKTLDVHVAMLRRRLADAAREVEAAAGTAPGRAGVDLPSITTLRGYGYRLDPPDAEVATTERR
jgi:DNA-binding response OmpR family regulator